VGKKDGDTKREREGEECLVSPRSASEGLTAQR